MKLTISILFCIILTSQYNSADGQLKNFFGRVHESANKVRQDVRTLFNPNTNNKQEENNDASTNIHFIEEVSKEDVGAAQTAKQVEVTPQPTTSTTTPAQNAPKNGTTGQGEEKDGRENFAGGCVPGFMRTADGRCKATF